jgi:CRP-like cAMP-binding protein
METNAPGISGLQLIGEGTTFQDTLVDMLAGSQFFNRYAGQELRLMTQYMHAYAIDAGTTVFSEGDPGNCMGLLVSGRIEVVKDDAEGNSKPIATISAGKTFGEMSLIDGLPYSATTNSTEPSTVILLTKENFRRCVQEHPALGVKLLWDLARLLSMRLRHTSGQLVEYLE